LKNRQPGTRARNANPCRQISHLRELIDALDRRVPRIERLGERQIAHDAAQLKERALKRIAELDGEVDQSKASPNSAKRSVQKIGAVRGA
jgi:hypothetical protein